MCDCLIVDTPIRFEHYKNAAGEFTRFNQNGRIQRKKSEGKRESVEDKQEVEVEEQEDLKQEKNVLKEEEGQICQMKFVQH